MDFTQGTSTVLERVTQDLKKDASQHQHVDFSCSISFLQVNSYTRIIIACGHQLVRIVLSTVRRGRGALCWGI